MNELRLSEVVRTYKHLLKHGSFEFEVKVSKRKKSEKKFAAVLEFLIGWVNSYMGDLYKIQKTISRFTHNKGSIYVENMR